MIDLKSKLILKILAKECENGNYKIIEISDIILSLPRHYRMDSEAVKHILTHLERQDIISIKYDDDNLFCLAVLPYGYQILEDEKYSKKNKNKKLAWANIIISFFSALLGTTFAIFLCYYILESMR
ncbi:MAG: hypothetical protein E7375_03585 [Clostridiales bacterium]|nr:hypothetical protein [Clostridiales bacterium]